MGSGGERREEGGREKHTDTEFGMHMHTLEYLCMSFYRCPTGSPSYMSSRIPMVH